MPSRGPNGSFASAAGNFQQLLTNMNVNSNAPGIVTGSGLQTGNIEFWSTNYGGANGAGVPNAAGNFDFGDTKSDVILPGGRVGVEAVRRVQAVVVDVERPAAGTTKRINNHCFIPLKDVPALIERAVRAVGVLVSAALRAVVRVSDRVTKIVERRVVAWVGGLE